jgi:hypothetical protein
MTTLLMPLGDSITAGQDSSSGQGYRKLLADNLYGPNESHTITQVGSQVDGAGWHHEGHGGWTIGQLIAGVQSGWLANPAPANAGPTNLVVLLAGANDFGAGGSWQQAIDDTSTLLDLILGQSTAPGVVLCEQILMSGNVSHVLTDNTRKQQAFNAALPDLVASKPAGRISIAHSGRLRQQDVNSGGVHPTDGGYARLEYEIYRALAPWLGWDDGAGGRWMVNRSCPYDSIPEV